MIKYYTLLLAALFLVTIEGKATHYEDFVLAENCIWALAGDGTIVLFDTRTGERARKKVPADVPVKILTTNHTGVPVIMDDSGRIRKYNAQNNTWSDVATCNPGIYSIVFDSKGNGYTIASEGITDLSAKETYYTGNSLNHQIHFKEAWRKPACHFIDRGGHIWLGWGFGEWGGELIIFSTTQKKFIRPELDHSFRIELWPVKSFFEDDKAVYMSAGLMHFDTKGGIVKFGSFRGTPLFISETEWGTKIPEKSVTEGEYMGPAAYNPYNQCIYFYSHNGFFRGDISKDLSEKNNWEKIIQPELQWTSGQPDAVGAPINVKKLSIIDKDRFVFLSTNDGIGLFDGKKLVMIH